jgi:hypothetical protein
MWVLCGIRVHGVPVMSAPGASVRVAAPYDMGRRRRCPAGCAVAAGYTR